MKKSILKKILGFVSAAVMAVTITVPSFDGGIDVSADVLPWAPEETDEDLPVSASIGAPVLNDSEIPVSEDLEVYMSWTKVAGATKYRVQRCVGKSTTWSTVSYTTDTFYSDCDVVYDTEYKYRVFAYAGTQMGPASNVVSVTLSIYIGNPELSAQSGNSKVVLSWNKVYTDSPTGVTKYRIQRCQDGSSTWSTIAYTSASTTTYTDTNVKNGITYRYRVFAYAGTKMGPASNIMYARPSSEVGTALLTGQTGVGKTTLSWTKVIDATKYRIQRCTGSSTVWSTIANVTGTSYTDTKVTNGTTYKYRVFAYVGTAMGRASNIVTITPVASVGTSVISAEAIYDESINDYYTKVNWTAVPNATKYRLQVWTEQTGVWKTLKILNYDSYYPEDCLLYYDYETLRGMTAKYRVYAYAGNSIGKSSNVVTVKTEITSLAAPELYDGGLEDIEEGTDTFDSLWIGWNDNSNYGKYRSYRVQRYDAAAKVWKTVAYTKEREYNDRDIIGGKTYKYRVYAYNGSVISPASKVLTITVPPNTPNVSYELVGRSVKIFWDKVPNADKYLIEKYDESTKKWTDLGSTTNCVYFDPDVKDSHEYCYRVYACSGSTKSCSGFVGVYVLFGID